MQPSPWDDLQTEGSAPQVMIDGQTAQISTGFNNQVILLQPPSSASKVIGILLILWGAINTIFLLLAAVGWSSSTIREEQSITTTNIILSSVSGIISVVTSILGGIWMMNFQRKGVYLVLIGIIIGFLFSIALSLTGNTDAAAANADMIEEVAGRPYADVITERLMTPAGQPRWLAIPEDEQGDIKDVFDVGDPIDPVEFKALHGVDMPETEVTNEALRVFNDPMVRAGGHLSLIHI
mgnify:CR=1 FL=1